MNKANRQLTFFSLLAFFFASLASFANCCSNFRRSFSSCRLFSNNNACSRSRRNTSGSQNLIVAGFPPAKKCDRRIISTIRIRSKTYVDLLVEHLIQVMFHFLLRHI